MSNGWLKNSSATFLWPEESFCDNLLTMMSMAAWKWIKTKMSRKLKLKITLCLRLCYLY